MVASTGKRELPGLVSSAQCVYHQCFLDASLMWMRVAAECVLEKLPSIAEAAVAHF
jgi:hypothetical protein